MTRRNEDTLRVIPPPENERGSDGNRPLYEIMPLRNRIHVPQCDQRYNTFEVFRFFDLASKKTTSEGPVITRENKPLRTLYHTRETHEYAITVIPSSAQVAMTVNARH